MIKRYSSITALITVLTITFSTLSFADSKMVEVTLKDITAQKVGESHGDELYFSITEYSNKSHPEIFRVPEFPNYWMSERISKVDDRKLWWNKLEENESIQVIFSLIERDMPPWNVDDHIGSVKLTVKNINGDINMKWSMPHYSDQTDVQRVEGDNPEFVLNGPNGTYRVEFSVELKTVVD